MTSEPDPRIQGFLKAISAYTGIPVAELEFIVGGPEHTGEGLAKPKLSALRESQPADLGRG